MTRKFNRGQFIALAAGAGGLAAPPAARATRFAQRYEFACEMSSGYSFLVDPLITPLAPHPSIAAQVRSGALKQRERVEFPYGDDDTMRSLAYFEDPEKPYSPANNVPAGDPRILIELLTDVTSILVRKEPFLHFTAMGMIVGNDTGTFFGKLESRVMIFSAALDLASPNDFILAVSTTASSHVLGARAGSGFLRFKEGGLL